MIPTRLLPLVFAALVAARYAPESHLYERDVDHYDVFPRDLYPREAEADPEALADAYAEAFPEEPEPMLKRRDDGFWNHQQQQQIRLGRRSAEADALPDPEAEADARALAKALAAPAAEAQDSTEETGMGGPGNMGSNYPQNPSGNGRYNLGIKDTFRKAGKRLGGQFHKLGNKIDMMASGQSKSALRERRKRNKQFQKQQGRLRKQGLESEQGTGVDQEEPQSQRFSKRSIYARSAEPFADPEPEPEPEADPMVDALVGEGFSPQVAKRAVDLVEGDLPLQARDAFDDSDSNLYRRDPEAGGVGSLFTGGAKLLQKGGQKFFGKGDGSSRRHRGHKSTNQQFQNFFTKKRAKKQGDVAEGGAQLSGSQGSAENQAQNPTTKRDLEGLQKRAADAEAKAAYYEDLLGEALQARDAAPEEDEGISLSRRNAAATPEYLDDIDIEILHKRHADAEAEADYYNEAIDSMLEARDAEAEAEADAEADADADADAEAEYDDDFDFTKRDAFPEPEAYADADAEAYPDAYPEAYADAYPDAYPEADAYADPEAWAEPEEWEDY